MIYPDCDMRRWEYCDNTIILANADDFYTKVEVDEIVDSISGLTPSDVEEMIDDKISTKADKSEVSAIAEQVRQNTSAILDRYTKSEVNSLLSSYKTKLEAAMDMAEYAAVNGTTLSLNDKNIGN